jgi:hypothetical protein
MTWGLYLAAWWVLSVPAGCLAVRLACFAVQATNNPDALGAVSADLSMPPTKLARRSPSNQQAPGISLDGEERRRLMARNIGVCREHP